MARNDQNTDSSSITDVEAVAGAEILQPTDAAVVAEAQPTIELGRRVSLRAVFGGPMINPLTEDRFTGEPSKPVTVDTWIKVQVEAGKIAVAE